ncbi:MAG TPA: CAP domain-containing protein [Jatrophihabitantaceae bacterium]|jgi:uncharacterized protein YkwD
MPSQQPARHRAAPKGGDEPPARHRPRTHRLIPGPAASQRHVLIAAGTVFCALFGFALATLPSHKSAEGDPLAHVPGAPDAARFAPVDAATFAPPASITRQGPRHGSTIGGAPQLGQESLPAIGSSAAGSGRTGGPGSAPAAPATGTSLDASSSPGPAAPGASSAPNPGSGASSGLPDADQVAQAVFDAINASRSAAGLRALRWNSGLQASARQHNQAMANANTLSHQTPGEADLGSRESNAGVFWWWAGENIATSSDLTQQAALGLENMMVSEQPPNDGHRQNILARNADSVGVDVQFDTVHHRLWLTEDFAQTSLL